MLGDLLCYIELLRHHGGDAVIRGKLVTERILVPKTPSFTARVRRASSAGIGHHLVIGHGGPSRVSPGDNGAGTGPGPRE
jgi:hypothetical protein